MVAAENDDTAFPAYWTDDIDFVVIVDQTATNGGHHQIELAMRLNVDRAEFLDDNGAGQHGCRAIVDVDFRALGDGEIAKSCSALDRPGSGRHGHP